MEYRGPPPLGSSLVTKVSLALIEHALSGTTVSPHVVSKAALLAGRGVPLPVVGKLVEVVMPET